MKAAISFEQRDCDTVLTLAGDVRVENAAGLKDGLQQNGFTRDLVIDWSVSEHVHSCILQLLLAQAKTLKQHGHSLRVEKDNPQVRGYLQLAGLSDHFPLREAAPPEASEKSNG